MIATGMPVLEDVRPDLYLRNAFRVTGVATDTPARDLRQRRRQLTAALDIGAPVRGAEPLSDVVTAAQVREAFDLLADPGQRLVQEAFWFWDPDGSCGCPEGAHGRHDAAVRAHANALNAKVDDAAEVEQYWTKSLKEWRLLLDSGDLGTHLRHRADVLDDPRLGPAVVDAIVAAIPVALVTLNANLAVHAKTNAEIDRQVSYLKRWATITPDALADVVDRVLTPLLDEVAVIQDKARLLRNQDRSLDAADLLVEKAKPIIMRARRIAAYDHHRRTAIMSNDTAIQLNNAWLDVSGDARRTGSFSLSLGRRGRELLDHALAMVVKDEDRAIMKENQSGLPPKARTRVPKPRVVKPKSAVRRWMDGVIASGDEEHLYDLVVRWYVSTDDPGLAKQLQAELGILWQAEEKRRRVRSARWAVGTLIVLLLMAFSAFLIGGVAAVVVAVGCGVIAGVVRIHQSGQRKERISKYLDPYKLPGGTS
jgi:hypothetical protein